MRWARLAYASRGYALPQDGGYYTAEVQAVGAPSVLSCDGAAEAAIDLTVEGVPLTIAYGIWDGGGLPSMPGLPLEKGDQVTLYLNQSPGPAFALFDSTGLIGALALSPPGEESLPNGTIQGLWVFDG